MAKEELRISPVKRSEPDLRKLARVVLVLVGELPPAPAPKRPKKGGAA